MKDNNLELLVDSKTICPGGTINCIVKLKIESPVQNASLELKFKGYESTKTEICTDDVTPKLTVN